MNRKFSLFSALHIWTMLRQRLKKKDDINNFLFEIINYNNHIKFKYEAEVDGSLPFLVMELINNKNKIPSGT